MCKSEQMVGGSESLQLVRSQMTRVAPTDATVLILGESGTGKELVARGIHEQSRRSARPFVRLNCASIPPALMISELFGHERGSFTGADQRRLGRFELANGGTIFLDEIGDIPPETQIALLRVLQEREIERIGGARPIPVDVRVIAATNRDLAAAVHAGKFRLDLFYRLNVFPIYVPPLRERSEDISLLVDHFVKLLSDKSGKTITVIPTEVTYFLKSYRWPGNIRELQNVIERAVILTDGERLSIDIAWMQQPAAETTLATDASLASSLSNQERKMIQAALDASRGRVSGPAGAATKLGMPRSTLESKIRALGIDKYRLATAQAVA